MERVKTEQVCYSYTFRELAIALGLAPQPNEWVVVEVDEDAVDVLVRQRVTP